MSESRRSLSYVLITPARNEESYIEQTIRSMIQQTVRPQMWVIVDDGSTDATPNIVRKYLPLHPWMELVQLPQHRDRSFAGKVFAFNTGLAVTSKVAYQVVGNLDADLSFDAEYCEFLVNKFETDPDLGVAGTVFVEDGYSSETSSFEGQNHVAGGCQLFRRQCFEQIGGYLPNRAGGIDWIAVTTARMMGWKTRSFREKFFFHHRSLGTADRGRMASLFSYGQKDYYLGGHPVWELFRVAYSVTKRPYLIGGIALYAGYLSGFIGQTQRPVSDELIRFHRREQMAKLRAILRSVVTLKRIDSFEVAVK